MPDLHESSAFRKFQQTVLFRFFRCQKCAVLVVVVFPLLTASVLTMSSETVMCGEGEC